MQPRNTENDLRREDLDLRENHVDSSSPELSQEIDGFLKTSNETDDEIVEEPVLDDEDLEENDLTEEELDEIEWEEETPDRGVDETR